MLQSGVTHENNISLTQSFLNDLHCWAWTIFQYCTTLNSISLKFKKYYTVRYWRDKKLWINLSIQRHSQLFPWLFILIASGIKPVWQYIYVCVKEGTEPNKLWIKLSLVIFRVHSWPWKIVHDSHFKIPWVAILEISITSKTINKADNAWSIIHHLIIIIYY